MKLIYKVISKLATQVRFKFLAVTIIVALLITTILFYILKEQEQSLRIFTEEQLFQTFKEKSRVEGELREVVIVKNKVEKELTAEKERARKLEVELKERNRQITLSLNKLEEEVTARRQAETKLLITLMEKRSLEERLQTAAQDPEVIELGKIIVTSNSLLSGEVLDVNEEYQFILVNLGRADGLYLGDILSVYRSGEFIGEVEVQRVEKSTAACVVLPAWKVQEFKQKDKVERL